MARCPYTTLHFFIFPSRPMRSVSKTAATHKRPPQPSSLCSPFPFLVFLFCLFSSALSNSVHFFFSSLSLLISHLFSSRLLSTLVSFSFSFTCTHCFLYFPYLFNPTFPIFIIFVIIFLFYFSFFFFLFSPQSCPLLLLLSCSAPL